MNSYNPAPDNTDEILALIDLLPGDLAEPLRTLRPLDQLLEIVIDIGRPPLARYTTGDIFLTDREITYDDIDAVTKNISPFDLDNRAGIERTLHRISAIRNRRDRIIGLTCRIGRAVYGTLDLIADQIDSQKSILLLGKPGIGKTTMLREAARVLSRHKRVVIVDTSNEIGGDGDIPHPAVGNARRLQVPRPDLQHEVMIEAVENHNPEVIIIDEIGRELEARAARTIAERGVQLIGTAHGRTLANLLMNPTLSDLIGGIQAVTLSDEEARRRQTQKVVLERCAPPTFDILVEICRRDQVLLYPDVAQSVDALVRNIEQHPELRTRTKDGRILREKGPAPVLEGAGLAAPDPQPSARKSRTSPLPREQASILAINAQNTSDLQPVPASRPLPRTLRIYPHGIARNRLQEAAERLGITIIPVSSLEEADLLMTLRPYYRERPSLIVKAEERHLPIHVLRSNTTAQIQDALGRLLQIEIPEPAVSPEEAQAEALRAVSAILSQQADQIDLRPADRSTRRIQRDLIEQSGLFCQPCGKEPNRWLRITLEP